MTPFDVEKQLSLLSLGCRQTPLFVYESLQVAGWKSVPTQANVESDQSLDDIVNMITGNLDLNIDSKDLPSLLDKTAITVTTTRHILPPEPKPNLLVITLVILDHYRRLNNRLTKEVLLKELCSFDIIMPRNPLKAIMTVSSEKCWEVYALRPKEGWPLYVNRVNTYSSTPGTVGNLFEKACTSKSPYHRVYSVGSGVFQNSGLRVAMTGEIDAVDSNGSFVEIKTQPIWVRSNQERDLDTWLQSTFAGVQTIVTGRFGQERGNRSAPVTFSKSQITYTDIDEFGRYINGKEEAIEYASSVLQKIVRKCVKIGVVYHVTGRRHQMPLFSIASAEFPISVTTIESCIEAILKNSA